MGAARFEGVDILDSLGQIMELHTQHYKDDFDMDKELIQNLVLLLIAKLFEYES